MSDFNSIAPAFAAVSSGDSFTAEVIAVFDRCCYLKLAGQLAEPTGFSLLCVGQASIQPGPINLLVEEGKWLLLKQRLHVGDRASAHRHTLVVAGVSINLAEIKAWQPPDIATLFFTSQPVIRERLANLGQHAPTGILFQQVMQQQSHATNSTTTDSTSLESAILSYITPLVSTLRTELTSSLLPAGNLGVNESKNLFPSAPQLLGAGSGLTPAGDDLLAGIMLSLRYAGFSLLANRLFKEIKPHLPARSNLISSAWLAEAAEGRAALPLVNVFATLGNPARVFDEKALAAGIGKIGHSSGWDCMAGLALVMQALQNTHRVPGILALSTTRQSTHA